MSESYSVAEDKDWKYSTPDTLVADGWLSVQGGAHHLYWHEYGNPKGEPVLFIHGGPGGSTGAAQARFFNPNRYRIVLFDQRGCGKSIPNVSSDPVGGLADNTTDHLIEDIEALRNLLGLTGPLHIFGGSWGSTLALSYAIKHPEQIRSLVLRGIFLCRKQDLDYLYQGNAATYAENPFGSQIQGAYRSYPEAWKIYVEAIPEEQRGSMVAAYSTLIKDRSHPNSDAAAIAWSDWEGSTSNLSKRPSTEATDPAFARTFAGIENHYFMHGAFLERDEHGNWNTNQNYILQNVGKITNGAASPKDNIKVFVVHGQFDQVCPRFQADELVAAFKAAGNVNVDFRITIAGHSQFDRATAQTLTAIMDGLSSPAPITERAAGPV